MKKTYIINDRTFEISISHICVSLYSIEIREIKYPNRKFFKKEFFSDDYSRDIDQFETVDEMVLDALKAKLAIEGQTEEEIKKWNDFEKTLDEPYIL